MTYTTHYQSVLRYSAILEKKRITQEQQFVRHAAENVETDRYSEIPLFWIPTESTEKLTDKKHFEDIWPNYAISFLSPNELSFYCKPPNLRLQFTFMLMINFMWVRELFVWLNFCKTNRSFLRCYYILCRFKFSLEATDAKETSLKTDISDWLTDLSIWYWNKHKHKLTYLQVQMTFLPSHFIWLNRTMKIILHLWAYVPTHAPFEVLLFFNTISITFNDRFSLKIEVINVNHEK